MIIRCECFENELKEAPIITDSEELFESLAEHWGNALSDTCNALELLRKNKNVFAGWVGTDGAKKANQLESLLRIALYCLCEADANTIPQLHGAELSALELRALTAS